jgi:hypothetical protein
LAEATACFALQRARENGPASGGVDNGLPVPGLGLSERIPFFTHGMEKPGELAAADGSLGPAGVDPAGGPCAAGASSPFSQDRAVGDLQQVLQGQAAGGQAQLPGCTRLCAGCARQEGGPLDHDDRCTRFRRRGA